MGFGFDGSVVWMETTIANMRVGVERGITEPRDVSSWA